MVLYKKHILIFFFLVLLSETELFSNTSIIDSLNSFFDEIVNIKSDTEKEKINDKLIYNFSVFLNNPTSFNADFSAIPYIQVLKSSDKLLNIITWNLAFSDGSFKYFGFLQYKNKGKLYVYFLQDRKYYNEQISEEEENAKKGYSTNFVWYGALYYEIITKKEQSNTYYTLLGWDGANYQITRKVIEVLHFSRNKPIFGGKVFRQDKQTSGRTIFEYSDKTSMMLRYSDKMNMIIFDHLSPSEEKYVGIPSFYGPDFSYDAFVFQGGRWNFLSNVDVTPAMPYTKNKNISTIKQHGFSKDF